MSLPPPLQQYRGTGHGSCVQFITSCFYCSLLLGERSPHIVPLLQRGFLPWGQPTPVWASLSTEPQQGCRGTAASPPREICREISALACGAPPAPHPSLPLSPELFLSQGSSFVPFLGHVIPEVVPQSLMGSALASDGSVLEPASVGSVRHRESFKHLLTEATPVTSPLLPITCPCKSSTELWQKKLISFISQETLK